MKVSAVNFNRNIYSNMSFKGSNEVEFKKNPNQILSWAPEQGRLKALGLNNYAEGGLACVSQEAPESWMKHYRDKGIDVRSCVPYHAPNNPKGKMLVAKLEKKEHLFDQNGIFTVKTAYPTLLDPKDIKYVDPDYQLKDGEHFVAVNADKTAGKHKYIILEDTGIKGAITSLKEAGLEKEKVPYRIFKYTENKDKFGTIYFVHTPQVAVMPKAYGKGLTYSPGQIIGSWYDLYYANATRASVDAMKQMEEKEGFNPANVWLHDRPAFVFQHELTRRSADGDSFYNGIKAHATFHNPGRAYQGFHDDPLGFMRIVFDEKDFDKLTQSPDFYELQDLEARRHDGLSESEEKRRDEILNPYFKNILDDTGKANTSMIPVANAKLNPENSSAGTVSKTYGKEMKTMTGIAEGMTKALSETKTIDITNGSTPANLKLDEITDFGRGDNTLSKRKFEYTPYKPILDKNGNIINYTTEEKGTMFGPDGKPVDKSKAPKIDAYVKRTNEQITNLKQKSRRYAQKYVMTQLKLKNVSDEKVAAKLKENLAFYMGRLEKTNKTIAALQKTTKYSYSIKEAKERNKKWLVNLIGDCVDSKGNVNQKALNEIFFNDAQLKDKKPAQVLGYLSKFEEGDQVFSSWGRPDPQKGFSTLLQGFHKFLLDDSVSDEQKKHTKLLLGSGPVWDKNTTEYKLIADYIGKIRSIDNGKYAGNVCYVDGFFPNKLVACSDWTIFTSRFEPCGITPLESFSSGTPVLSIKTGGAPDFVVGYDGKSNSDKANGFLTEDPFMLEPETLGISKEGMDRYEYEDLLDEKRRDKLSDEISSMFKKAVRTDNETYDKLALNACKQYVDWHENSAYNNGKTANERYMGEVFDLDENLQFAKPRNTQRLNKLTGEFGDSSATKIEIEEDPIEASRRRVEEENRSKHNVSFGANILTDKRTLYIAGSVAAVAGIASYALYREKSTQASLPKPTKIGNSTVYFA